MRFNVARREIVAVLQREVCVLEDVNRSTHRPVSVTVRTTLPKDSATLDEIGDEQPRGSFVGHAHPESRWRRTRCRRPTDFGPMNARPSMVS